tara:strand:+ start:29820 stop:32003 length:2184 start_codon:yes stop_codon:yes gene_type:complete
MAKRNNPQLPSLNLNPELPQVVVRDFDLFYRPQVKPLPQGLEQFTKALENFASDGLTKNAILTREKIRKEEEAEAEIEYEIGEDIDFGDGTEKPEEKPKEEKKSKIDVTPLNNNINGKKADGSSISTVSNAIEERNQFKNILADKVKNKEIKETDSPYYNLVSNKLQLKNLGLNEFSTYAIRRFEEDGIKNDVSDGAYNKWYRGILKDFFFENNLDAFPPQLLKETFFKSTTSVNNTIRNSYIQNVQKLATDKFNSQTASILAGSFKLHQDKDNPDWHIAQDIKSNLSEVYSINKNPTKLKNIVKSSLQNFIEQYPNDYKNQLRMIDSILPKIEFVDGTKFVDSDEMTQFLSIEKAKILDNQAKEQNAKATSIRSRDVIATDSLVQKFDAMSEQERYQYLYSPNALVDKSTLEIEFIRNQRKNVGETDETTQKSIIKSIFENDLNTAYDKNKKAFTEDKISLEDFRNNNSKILFNQDPKNNFLLNTDSLNNYNIYKKTIKNLVDAYADGTEIKRMGELFVTSLEFSAKKWLQSEEALKLKTMKEKQDGFNKFIEDWVSTEMQTLKYKGLQDIFTGETIGDSGSEQTRPIDIGEFVTTEPKENIKKDKEELVGNTFDATTNKAKGTDLVKGGDILVGTRNENFKEAVEKAFGNTQKTFDFGKDNLVLLYKESPNIDNPTGFEFITESEFENKYQNKIIKPVVTVELAQAFGFPPEVIKFLKDNLANFK